MAASKQNYI